MLGSSERNTTSDSIDCAGVLVVLVVVLVLVLEVVALVALAGLLATFSSAILAFTTSSTILLAMDSYKHAMCKSTRQYTYIFE